MIYTCITPHVIEPSFGLGRIIYSILEHSYVVRDTPKRDNDSKEEEKRAYLSLPPIIAPTKVILIPLPPSHPLASSSSILARLTL